MLFISMAGDSPAASATSTVMRARPTLNSSRKPSPSGTAWVTFPSTSAHKPLGCSPRNLTNGYPARHWQRSVSDDLQSQIWFAQKEAAAVIRPEIKRVNSVPGHFEKSGELKTHIFITGSHAQIQVGTGPRPDRFQLIEIRKGVPQSFVAPVIQPVLPTEAVLLPPVKIRIAYLADRQLRPFVCHC